MDTNKDNILLQLLLLLYFVYTVATNRLRTDVKSAPKRLI